MSSENSEKEIVKKLDKVADSLETTTSQLSSVVTQQQLDVIRERISKCESELTGLSEVPGRLSEKIDSTLNSSNKEFDKIQKSLESLERDYAAIRALVFSAFALSTVSIIGLVICSIYL